MSEEGESERIGPLRFRSPKNPRRYSSLRRLQWPDALFAEATRAPMVPSPPGAVRRRPAVGAALWLRTAKPQ
jgi:hypothetical protein